MSVCECPRWVVLCGRETDRTTGQKKLSGCCPFCKVYLCSLDHPPIFFSTISKLPNTDSVFSSRQPTTNQTSEQNKTETNHPHRLRKEDEEETSKCVTIPPEVFPKSRETKAKQQPEKTTKPHSKTAIKQKRQSPPPKKDKSCTFRGKRRKRSEIKRPSPIRRTPVVLTQQQHLLQQEGEEGAPPTVNRKLQSAFRRSHSRRRRPPTLLPPTPSLHADFPKTELCKRERKTKKPCAQFYFAESPSSCDLSGRQRNWREAESRGLFLYFFNSRQRLISTTLFRGEKEIPLANTYKKRNIREATL